MHVFTGAPGFDGVGEDPGCTGKMLRGTGKGQTLATVAVN
jgi:hypothetical protein